MRPLPRLWGSCDRKWGLDPCHLPGANGSHWRTPYRSTALCPLGKVAKPLVVMSEQGLGNNLPAPYLHQEGCIALFKEVAISSTARDSMTTSMRRDWSTAAQKDAEAVVLGFESVRVENRLLECNASV
jgi:hypothetical protein